MHTLAVRQRGYNQSEELALELGTCTGLPVLPLLEKRLLSTPQHRLGREERWHQLRQGAFGLAPGVLHQANLGSVILIDDVMTTGATAHYCSQLLLGAGALRVGVLTVAR